MKRWLIGFLAALVVGVGVLGGAMAVSAQEESTSGGVFDFASVFWDKLAAKLGIDSDQLKQAARDAANETVDEALQQGWLTEDQAQSLRDRIAQSEPGFPWGKRGWRWGWHWGMKAGGGVLWQAAAQVLGVSVDELKSELGQGKSLAQVAQEKGLSVEGFRSGLLEAVGQQLNQLVEQGRLTQQQADALKQAIENNIDAIINAQGPCPFHWPKPLPSGNQQQAQATRA